MGTSEQPDLLRGRLLGLGVDVARDLCRSRVPGERMQVGVGLAVALVPACDHAGITLVAGKRYTSGASSDGVAARADEIQHEALQGPGVYVARWKSSTLYVPDLNGETRWPRWTPAVREELGVGSLLSVLLFTHGRSSGALNLYCDRPDAFTGADVARAQDLAAHLAVAISDSKDLQNRDKGMSTRTVIGQAQGILMERYTIGADEAFAFLQRTSQDSNRKVAQIAQELVETRDLPQVDSTAHDEAITP